jgi:hypothetical protein
LPELSDPQAGRLAAARAATNWTTRFRSNSLQQFDSTPSGRLAAALVRSKAMRFDVVGSREKFSAQSGIARRIELRLI